MFKEFGKQDIGVYNHSGILC